MSGAIILMIVIIKLIVPKIEETLAKCKERMVRSMDAPAWARFSANGGSIQSACSSPSCYY